jgi:hypothetical protein
MLVKTIWKHCAHGCGCGGKCEGKCQK